MPDNDANILSPQAVSDHASGETVPNCFTYKGYVGYFSHVDPDDSFCGRVIGIKDVVTFEGKTPDELRRAFAGSVDDYLEWCKKDGREPEKPAVVVLNVAATLAAGKLPPLETPCEECDGEGGGDECGHWTDCPFCNGSGYVPTDLGEKILELVRHNLSGKADVE